MTTDTNTEIVIDASGKRLGRLATDVAATLMGKNSTSFAKHTAASVTVRVTNASKIDVSDKKKENETYATFSGYPGGLKKETLGHLGDRRGYAEVLRRTVGGMIPNNKLKKLRLKNLLISE
jgi:large subunit ribosomal protein L13